MTTTITWNRTRDGKPSRLHPDIKRNVFSTSPFFMILLLESFYRLFLKLMRFFSYWAFLLAAKSLYHEHMMHFSNPFTVTIDIIVSFSSFNILAMPRACGILVPWPGIEPPPSQWLCWILTTGLAGSSHPLYFNM